MAGGDRGQALVESTGIAFLEAHGRGSKRIRPQRLLEEFDPVFLKGSDLSTQRREYDSRQCIRFQKDAFDFVAHLFLN
jgi:hypothetical protein